MNQAANDEWGIKLEFVSVRAAEVFVVCGIYKDKGKKIYRYPETSPLMTDRNTIIVFYNKFPDILSG